MAQPPTHSNELIPDLASEWHFFGIFNSTLDRKIPEIPESRRSGFHNPEKSRVHNPKILEIGIGI